MTGPSREAYDAVIIGAGIGGLVCGCYLAKAGMKVLIAEQHHKPGGYCTAFRRQGFTFDAAPHCFGSYREGGIMKKVLRDLDVENRLAIIRPDPSDTIITPDYKISFWNDLNKTIEEFQAAFPADSGRVREFFYLLMDTDPRSFSQLRSMTFKDLLDQHFSDEKLKAILSFPFFGIGGLPSYLISAFVGAKLFSEFLLDGGYYPQGGMQAIPDALAERFREAGGELRLSSMVRKIRVKDGRVTGVVTEKEGFVPASYVVSNCDARQTFFKLLGREVVEEQFRAKIKEMVPSMSTFIAYLGMDESFRPFQNPGTALFFSPHYDLDRACKAMQVGDIERYGGYALRIAHDRSTIYVGIPAPFKGRKYWADNKHRFLETLIERIEKYTIPDLSRHIVYKDAATPQTLHRYTLNFRGASFGWAGLPSQFAVPGLRKPPFVQNLYLAGHWTTLGVGVSGTAYVGYDTAKLILRKKHI